MSKVDTFAYGLSALKAIVDRHSFGDNKELQCVTDILEFLGEGADAYIAYRLAHPAPVKVDPQG